MCDILPFKLRRSKQVRAARPDGSPCDVVIFTGTRIDHSEVPVTPVPAITAALPGVVV